jgi:uncharacterized protein (TIGR02284 family)
MIDRSEHAVLNHLIESCRDGERGFRLAADLVKNPKLKELFTQMAAQRAAFAKELLPHAQRFGGNPPADSTALGALHRGWMALEGKIIHEDHVIVAEAEQGSGKTLDLYYNAVNGMLAPEVREVVERQFREMKEMDARIPVREGLGQ